MLIVIHKCFPPTLRPFFIHFVLPFSGESLEYQKILRDLTCLGLRAVIATTLRQHSLPFACLIFAYSRLCVA